MQSEILTKIKIRPLTNSDNLNELTLLLNRSYKKLADQGFKYLASHQDTEITKYRIEKGQCFVATLDNKIIATICYYLPDRASGNDWYNQEFVASYGQFAVDPPFQKLGLGGQLIDLVEKIAMSDNAKEIAIDTAEGASELIDYYKKRGYRFVDYAQWAETNYRSVVLSKKIYGL